MAPSKTIFVANIPYDVSEEQLSGVFSEVGPVSSVEIKFDTQTGRSKGYAFVHYFDEATAASAVRNLHEVLVNGRNLRVESSTDEPDHRNKRGGPGPGRPARGGGPGVGDRGGPGGPGGPGGFGGPPIGGGGGGGYGARPDEQLRGGPPPPTYGRPDDHLAPPPPPGQVDISLLPPGQDVPPGQKATDVISKTLAAISPGQMQDVMSGMKTLIATQPDQARQLLQSKPQLAYALFQAMLLMNIIDPSVLQRIQPLPPTASAAPAYPPPNPAYPPYPPAQSAPPPSNYPPYPPQPQSGYRPPSDPRAPAGGGGYNAPPPPSQSYAPPPSYGAPPSQAPPPIPPQAQAALATLPEDQRAMLMQVLQMTPDQISALDAPQQASIMQLRQQFLGMA